MSIKHMTLVWDHSKHEGSALLLLLAIADCADEHGEAWPGHRFLAQRIRLSRSAVQYLLAKIVKSHELKIIHRGGSGTADANHYRIALKGQPAGPKSQGQPAGPLGPVQGQSRASDHAQILPEPLEPIEPINTTSSPPPPPAATMTDRAVAGGELAIVESSWSWRSIPNLPARRKKAQSYPPEKLIALYLYYLTQSGIKSPLRAALARVDRGEIDPGQIFDQLGELPPASLAILLNWLAEGASDYTTADLNGAAVLGHAYAELFKQTPSGIQSRPQQERQAEAEQQTIRSIAVHALTDLDLWRLLPAIEPVGPTSPDVVMRDRQVSEPDLVMPPNMETWQAVLDNLRLEMSHATFDAWIRETELSSIGPDRFVIGVPTTYARDWLENRMTARIARTLALITGSAWPVKFEVKGK